jgi:TetR/AcrR family transcriptional regulator, transcriptional repressor for nem operon
MGTVITTESKPRKGERTRQRIVERAAPVFNQRGFAGASMNELVAATGLEKGGIYNHFGSKEALAIEALDYSVSLLVDRFARALASPEHAADRLVAVIDAFAELEGHPDVPGGCPVANTALESDDTNPELCGHARKAMDSWHRLIGSIVKTGKQRGELRTDTDPYELATVLTATLEGALMLSRLMQKPAHMRRATAHLKAHVDSLRAGA